MKRIHSSSNDEQEYGSEYFIIYRLNTSFECAPHRNLIYANRLFLLILVYHTTLRHIMCSKDSVSYGHSPDPRLVGNLFFFHF